MSLRTEKTPTEVIPVLYDFVDDLVVPGETVNTGLSSVTVTDPNGLDVTGSMVVAWSISAFKIAAKIQGGTNGTSYTVQFILKTTNYRFEGVVTLYVRNN